VDQYRRACRHLHLPERSSILAPRTRVARSSARRSAELPEGVHRRREGRRGFADVACNPGLAAGRVIPQDRRISPSPVTCLTSPPRVRSAHCSLIRAASASPAAREVPSSLLDVQNLAPDESRRLLAGEPLAVLLEEQIVLLFHSLFLSCSLSSLLLSRRHVFNCRV